MSVVDDCLLVDVYVHLILVVIFIHNSSTDVSTPIHCTLQYLHRGWIFEGTAIYLATLWGYPIFLAGGDCEPLYPLISFSLTMLSNYSGDDLAGVCNVESIQIHSLCSPVHFRATDDCVPYFFRYLLQSQYPPLRCVPSQSVD